MSDDPIELLRAQGLVDDEPAYDPVAEVRYSKAIAEANERARKLLATSPHCVVCGGLITTRGKHATHHYSCEPQAPTTPTADTLGAG